MSETQVLFDVPENGFDRGFAFGVNLLAFAGLHAMPHGVDLSGLIRRGWVIGELVFQGCVVLFPAIGKIGFDVLVVTARDVGLTEVTGIPQ